MRLLVGIGLVTMMAFAMTTTSCNKYEEGPGFTLLTAKMRITGNWTMIKRTVNDTDFTSFAPSEKLDIKKDETFTWTIGSYTYTGTWKFNSDKTEVIFTDSSGDVDTFTIVQLKNNIMKLKKIVDGDEYITTYEQ